MESLGSLVVTGLVVLIPAILGVAIYRLVGDDGGVSLAEFMAPLSAPDAAAQPRSRPAVPEPEPVAWRFDQMATTGSTDRTPAQPRASQGAAAPA